MPMAPRRPCRFPLCPNLTHARYCDAHRSEHARDNRQRVAQQGIYDWRWRQYSKRRLKLFPLCANCERRGRVEIASVTDHIIPHRGDLDLFWEPTNHESKCIVCHNKKSGGEVIYRG